MSWKLGTSAATAAFFLAIQGSYYGGPVGALAAATATASTSSSIKGAECFEYGYDYYGFDIQQVPFVISAAACMEECARYGGCGVFTYDTVSRMCYLKSLGAFTDRRPSAKMLSGPRQCTFTAYCYDVGMDYYGEDVERVEGRYVMTPMDCQRLCSANPQCAFFSWKLSTHACYLKSSAASLNRRGDSDVTSGPRTCSTTGSTVTPSPEDYPTEFDPATAPPSCVETGVEYKGFTVKSTRATSAAACHRECQQYSGCYYWTFSAQTEVCSLKNSEAFSGRTENVTTLDKVSAARDCIPVMPGCQYANVGVIGARLTTRAARSFDMCQIYCATQPGCTHFSHNIITEECTLWSSFNTYSQGTSTEGVVSGPAFCNAGEICYEQSDYVGHNVDEDETGDVKSPAACQNRCRESPECHYWTYYADNKGCYLKDANAILGRANDMTSLGRFSGPKYCTVSHGCVLINAVYTGLAFNQLETEDYQACSSLCASDAFCSTWTFHTGLSLCSLFSDGASLARMPVRGAVSGDKTCSFQATLDDSCFEEGILFKFENPLKVSHLLTAKACYAACRAEGRCTYWSFENGRCHLSTDTQQPAFVYDPVSVSGPKLCPGETLAGRLVNTSSPFLQTYTYTPRACMQKCGQTPRCKSFSFEVEAEELNCSLFEKTSLSSGDGFLSGLMMPPSFIASQCTFQNPLASVSVSTPLECHAHCLANSLCDAWQTKSQPGLSQVSAVATSAVALTCTLFKTADKPSQIMEPNTKCGTKLLPGTTEVVVSSTESNATSGSPFVDILGCLNTCYSNPECTSWVFDYNTWCRINPVSEKGTNWVGGTIVRPPPILLFNTSYVPRQQAAAAPADLVSRASRLRLTSGFRRQLPARSSGLAPTSAKSYEDCITACSKDASCTAWTFKDGTCSTFSTPAVSTPDSGAISGLRSTTAQPYTFVLNKKCSNTPSKTYAEQRSSQAKTADEDGELDASKDGLQATQLDVVSTEGDPVPGSALECAAKTQDKEYFSFKSSDEGNVCYIYTACGESFEVAEGFVSGTMKESSTQSADSEPSTGKAT